MASERPNADLPAVEALLRRNRDLEYKLQALKRAQSVLMRTLVLNTEYQVLLESVVKDAGLVLPNSTCIKKYTVPIDTKD